MGRWCIVGRVCFGIMCKKEGISVWWMCVGILGWS